MKLVQIKEQVAALLNVELVFAAEVRQVLNTELANTELNKANWNAKTTWEAALAILNNAKYDRKSIGTGVKENLSSCAGGVTGNTLKSSEVNSNDINSTKGQEYKLFLPEVIPAIIDKLDDNNTYKVDRGSGHTPVVYHLCVDNKDGQTKLLVIIGSWLALSTIQMYYRDNLISKAIKPETTSTIVTTETSDNITEFKGIPVEHYNFKHEVYIDSVLKDTSGVLISKYLGTHAVSFNDGEQRKSDVSLLKAVKLAKEWLGVNTVRVPSVEQAIQPSKLEFKSIYA